mmetsp:Transcript_30009/g.70081  ORF Transcript_30009/g.70081 Transcript_30009/m.70081 type:complete len:450 (+) Transcript_30009:36-1385(+)
MKSTMVIVAFALLALVGSSSTVRLVRSPSALSGARLARVPIHCAPRASTADEARPRRVRFLFSDTGGGHRASALALQGAIESMYPGQIECDLVDLFVASEVWPFCEAPAAYRWMAERPAYWKAFFEAGATPFGAWLNEVVTDCLCGAAYRKLLAASPRPDCVVSVHPLMQGPALRALADIDGGIRKTPFATVVTDLGSAHPKWFHTGVDKCYVPSDVLVDIARGVGLETEQVVLHGLPIRKAFWQGRTPLGSKQVVRQTLGLDSETPTCLVVGGGDGMGGLFSVASAVGSALGEREGSSQLVVVCGRNEECKSSLGAVKWPSNVHVMVLGFVSEMEQWMGAADALVTKAGPGTIAEAAAMGLPCVLSGYLPGQEEGNVDFVISGGFGKLNEDPAEIGKTVRQWLDEPDMLAAMSTAASAAARPDATSAIASDLAKLVLGEVALLSQPVT